MVILTLETFKCFAEWTGLEHGGTVIASFGTQTVKEFSEYTEEARKLGKTIKEDVVGKQKV